MLDTGNAHGLDLDVDGVPTRLTGAVVLHNVPIKADLLVAGSAARRGIEGGDGAWLSRSPASRTSGCQVSRSAGVSSPSGQRGRGAKSSPSASPSRSRSIPAQATITALSVHSRTGGASRVNPAAAAASPQRRADRAVRRHAAGHHQQPRLGRSRAHHRHGMRRAVRQHLRHGALEAGRNVRRHAAGNAPVPQARHHLRHRGLQPGEAEIAPRPPQHRPGKS